MEESTLTMGGQNQRLECSGQWVQISLTYNGIYCPQRSARGRS